MPFLRLDSADNKRTHFDVREFFGLFVFDNMEIGVGARKVFWGVTESQHLVDIINQTDSVESPDGEEKLGQPMLNVAASLGGGTVELFVMPYFRERTFQGKKGRLRAPLVVVAERAEYESGAKEWHTDFALRYSTSLGDWDVGLSQFTGTGREPTLKVAFDKAGRPVLIPFYEQINQSGLDVQLITGEWLWKLEGIRRSGQAATFCAATGGFEYTFVGIGGSAMDLGVLSEWLYDERGEGAPTPNENDVMAGFRLAVNDIESTEVLAGVVQDTSGPERVFFVEASRRLTDHWKATLEARAFSRSSQDDILASVGNDDHLQFELAYYF